MLYSFDIFDTLITRKTASPEGIFALMQRSLFCDGRFSNIPDWIKADFYSIRIRAQKRAWRIYTNTEIREITLEQIYLVVENMTGLEPGIIEDLISLEREIESNSVIPVKKNIEKAIRLKESGEKVVFISDMYLDVDTIRNMLKRADERLTGIPLYVSSRYMKNKSSGLYGIVKKDFGIDYNEWMHAGDNPNSDVAVPEGLGIITSPFEGKVLLPIEKNALDYLGNDVNVQLMIGASANARINGENSSAAYKYGTSIIIPILYNYSKWIIYWAEKNIISDLYFIARDAYLIKKSVDIILDKTGKMLETHYLYGSRKAWRLTALSEIKWDLQEMLKWMGSIKDNTFKYVADCFEMECSELNCYLSVPHKKDDYISHTERKLIFSDLENNCNFKDCIIKKQERKRKLAVDYLREAIEFKKNGYAFVDFVGSGYTQTSLSGLLSDLADYPVKSLFYRLDADLSGDICEFYTYNSDFMKKSIIEALLYAPHGSTVGYEVQGDLTVPVLDDENLKLEQYGMGDFLQGITDAFSYIDEDIEMCSKLEQLYIEYIENTPDEELASFIGGIPFSKNSQEGILTYAPELTDEDIKNIFLIRINEPIGCFYDGIDLEYSLMRCNDQQKQLIEEYKKMKDSREAHEQRIQFWKNSDMSWCRISGYEELFLKTGKRLVIYGAGKYGSLLADMIMADESKELVLWVDSNYKKITDRITVIKSPELIKKTEYDSIIIAIKNRNVAMEIKNNLKTFNIDEDRICFII